MLINTNKIIYFNCTSKIIVRASGNPKIWRGKFRSENLKNRKNTPNFFQKNEL
jgi:hypothetical protein